MEKQNLSHLKVGDKVAQLRSTVHHRSVPKNFPRFTYDVSSITARTKTRITIKPVPGVDDWETVIRVSDGKGVGDDESSFKGTYFIEATPEIIEKYEAEKLVILRYKHACRGVDSLIGKSHATLNLTTEQMEALGKAWAEIQAMVK